MSFLVKTPQLPASTAQDAAQFSTYRESDPVPFGFGRERFASRWLCEPYAWHTRPMGSNRPDMQICSVAAGYCAGPADFIGKVWRDGAFVRNLDTSFWEHGNPESMEFAIPELGPNARLIIHRGTHDAPASAVANLNAQPAGQNHPPYRGLCWGEWRDIDLGQGVTALPDLQVELGRRTPAIGTFGPSIFGHWGVNVFAAVHAILTDESGFGLDAAYFDAAEWAAQCQALEDTGIAARTSYWTFANPIFKSAQDAAALLSTVLAHVDGLLHVDGGKFRIDWFPSQPPPGGLPEITEHDLEAAPAGAQFPDWNKGAGSTVVIYRDFDRDYNDTPAITPSAANRETGIAATPTRVERPMIHDAEQAAMIAAEISASRGNAEASITLKVQKSRAVNGDGSPLMPGDLFVWDYAPHSLDLVMRVVGRRIRAGETADLIEAIPERGQFPLPYVPPLDERVLPQPDEPGVINVADVRLWLMPSGLSELREIVPLVARSKRTIYRVDLHMSTTGAAPWERILDCRFFPAKCAVTNGGIGSGAGTVRVTSTSVDFARMAAQNAVAQADDTLVLLVGNELVSVGAITVVAPNTYDLAILRGRRGTVAAAHADGAVAWLFYRAEIYRVEHAEFYRVRDGSNAYHVGTATKYFKFQLFTIDADGLAKPEDPGLAFTLPDLSADESMGYTILLTNEAHTVACDAAGNVLAGQLGASGTARTDVKVFRGATALTPVAVAPNSDQFSISITAVTNATGTKEDNDTVRADTLSADTGTITIEVNVAGAFNLPKVFTLTKAKQGTPGTPGATGNSRERRYIRSAMVPATPFGNNPAGWTLDIPSGTDALWASEATKDGSGNVVGSWSTPQRLSGSVIFYTAGPPSGHTLIAGDTYFDIADSFKIYRYNGSAWVAAFQPLIKLDANNNVTGLVKADGTDKDFVLVANKFQIWDGASPQVPFEVVGGFVYIKQAFIEKISAGKIDTGTINAAISIGSSGYLKAGSGFSEFLVDTTKMKYGAFLMEAFTGVGNQMRMGKFDGSGNFVTGFFANGGDNFGNMGLHYNGANTIDGLASSGEWRAKKFTQTDATQTSQFSGDLSVLGALKVPGAVGSAGGIRYAGGTTNLIAFYWDGSNVRVVVDGTLQGTIPNP